MSGVRNYLLTVDRDRLGAAQIAHTTATKLEGKQVALVDIVQSLGEYINDEDSNIRSKAVQYLSEIIGQLTPTFLTRQQVQVLCQFFCDRIEDGGSVGGLTKLQKSGRYNQEMAIMTFRALLEHFQDLQVRSQSQRLPILELLNALMSDNRSALKGLGEESLIGITDLVSGEKDPRNLMIIFSILKVIMVEWDMSGHAESLFDSVFCYFPITFRPPPDDPYGITAQDLKTRLRDCISASKYLAPYAFPQLIDKLDSTSLNVKRDVLQTICACALSYDVTTVSSYSTALWDSLKYEVFNVQEEDLAEEALEALRAIAVRLSSGLTSAEVNPHLFQYLNPIAQECSEHLQAPQHKQAKPAGQIISSLGTASPFALLAIVKIVMPTMLTLYQDADDVVKKRALLEVILQVLQSAMSSYGSTNIPTELENPLEPFKDRLFEITSQALMSTAKEEVSFRVVALKCLVRLCSLRKYLQENEIGMAVQYFDDIILLEDYIGRDDLKDEAIQALVEISRIKPFLIMDITFPAFMSRLPDISTPGSDDYIIILDGLARLSVERAISDTLIRRLLNRLDLVLYNGGNVEYPQAILSTLYYVLSRRNLASDPNLDSYYDRIVIGLASRTALAAAGLGLKTALNQVMTLEMLGRLSNLIVRAVDLNKQQSTAAQIYSLFSGGQSVQVPFGEDVEPTVRSTMILSTYLIAALPREVHLPYVDADGTDFRALLKELVRLSVAETSPMIRESMLRQIALLVNKFTPPLDLSYTKEILWAPSTGLFNNLSDNSIRVIFWIAKALILRLAMTDEVLEHLLDLLTNVSHGVAAARGFGLLLAPDELLSRENGAVIRLLAKQKVFTICVPTITTDYWAAGPSTKSNYLIALSGILKYTSIEILMPSIGMLMPLLLQSLDLNEQDVKAATIETTTIFSQENPRAVEEHISSLISRLLRLAADSKMNTSMVRVKALRCLKVFPGRVKPSSLLSIRSAVTRGMMKMLDDPKREVRKEAVDCRTAWLNMDEPDEDE